MARSTAWVTKIVALVLALALPVVIVAGAVAALESFRANGDARETRNAGKVINGRVVQGGVVQVIERKLAETEPDVIILGNSLSNTDILPAVLAARLGIHKSKVQRFSVPNSIGAHWYAILKNRVYANGHTPSIIIILSDMQSALAVAPRSEASQQNLRVQLNKREKVIHRKIGEPNYILERVRENRTKVRDRMLKSARNTMVDLLVNRSITPTPPKKTEAALDRVFDASKTDMRLHGDVIPTFGTTDSLSIAFDPESLPIPRESFLPEITRLVAQHDGHVVYLRPPMSPLLPANVGDLVLPETEDKVIKLVDRMDGTYLDMRGLRMDDGHFHNIDHMNPEGARRFTEVTAVAMADLGVWKRPGVPLLDLLRPIDFNDGALVYRDSIIEPRRDPPTVPRNVRPIELGRKNLPFMAADALAALADEPLVRASPFASRCSPIRVLEDGIALPMHNMTCEEVVKHRKGRTCHTTERIYFTPRDDSDPLTNGRTYKLVLDADRHCEGAVWMYPDDHIRVQVDDDDVAAMPRPAHKLRFTATVLGEGIEGDVSLELRVGGALRASATVPASQLAEGLELPVQPPLRPRDSRVSLHLRSSSGRFVLVTRAALGN